MTISSQDLRTTLRRDRAIFDPERVFRYALARELECGAPDRTCLFLMLNPSTADETVLDPTIRRCIGFASGFDCGFLVIGNIFALRSTDPRGLKEWNKNNGRGEAVGPRNEEYLRALVEMADLVICGWGNHGSIEGRGAAVAKLLSEYPRKTIQCLGYTKKGEPKHPLYLKSSTPPVRFPNA